MFIELTDVDDIYNKFSINKNYIIQFWKNGNGTGIETTNRKNEECIFVMESYDKVKQLLNS